MGIYNFNAQKKFNCSLIKIVNERNIIKLKKNIINAFISNL